MVWLDFVKYEFRVLVRVISLQYILLRITGVEITFELLHNQNWIGLGDIKSPTLVIFNMFILQLFQVNTAKINLLEVAENIKARRRANKRLSEQMAEKVCEYVWCIHCKTVRIISVLDLVLKLFKELYLFLLRSD